MGRRRGIAGLVGATLILCAFAVSPASARPATGSEPATVWIADGTVSSIDVRTMQVTSWAPKLENGKDSGDPSVDAIAATGDGATIYLGGEFVRVGRRPRASIASFAADGHLLPFNPHPDSSVSALGLDVHHHVVYFAGDFTHVDGAERPSLAAVDATTGRLTKWNPDCDGTGNAI